MLIAISCNLKVDWSIQKKCESKIEVSWSWSNWKIALINASAKILHLNRDGAEDITWPLGDTKFLFECWKYFTSTVAHRGHATYIFISRDKNTVYRAINWELSRDKFKLSRDKSKLSRDKSKISRDKSKLSRDKLKIIGR